MKFKLYCIISVYVFNPVYIDTLKQIYSNIKIIMNT